MKVPLWHLKWSKARDINASKGSGHLQGLAAAGMQQRVCRGTKVLPIGTEKAGRCLSTFAALGLNFPSKDSNNNTVTGAAYIHLQKSECA